MDPRARPSVSCESLIGIVSIGPRARNPQTRAKLEHEHYAGAESPAQPSYLNDN
jgi:hypothetical protein